MSIDFRACLYALSDVLINRPPPLRHFDQIYMKLPDMLLQAEVVSRWFDGKRLLFIGDGDAIGLSVVHLSARQLVPGKPSRVLVLDFDERIVNSVNHFARTYGIAHQIQAELYNVADPLPPQHWQAFDGFYTNPPWGSNNGGSSVTSFVLRGIEGAEGPALGCIVIGDHPRHPWTHQVQLVTQRFLLEQGFRVAEMLPEFHRYHLDDAPELTSCCMIVQRGDEPTTAYASKPLGHESLQCFYGREHPLRVRYVRDLTNGGKFVTHDVKLEPIEEGDRDAGVT
jgi:predicted methyltransferase